MVSDFIKKMRAELLERKIKLEDKQNKLQNEMERNDKFLQKLMQEEDQVYDIFSPRRKNLKMRDNIEALEQKQDALRKSDKEVGQKLDQLELKLKDLENILMQERKKSAGEIKLSKSVQKKERADEKVSTETNVGKMIQSAIQKTELCLYILMVDPNRCRLELNEVKKMLRELQVQIMEKEGFVLNEGENEWEKFGC